MNAQWQDFFVSSQGGQYSLHRIHDCLSRGRTNNVRMLQKAMEIHGITRRQGKNYNVRSK